MQHLSLTKRVALLKKRYGITVKTGKLRYFYKKHKVKWVNTLYKLYGEDATPELKRREREDFASELEKIIDCGAPLIYLDETTFTSWMHSRKAWAPAGHPLKVTMTKKHGSNFTLIGALSANCLNQYFYGTTVPSTNKETFLQFLLDLKDQILSEYAGVKPYLVMDNHSAHHSRLVKPVLEEFFTILWMPSYSCQFNSIEQFWGILKKRVVPKYTRLLFKREATVEHLKSLVELEVSEISDEICTNTFYANLKYLNSFLPDK